MDPADIENRFEFHPAGTGQRRGDHEFVRHHCGVLAELLNERVPEGPEKALVMTNLE